VHSSGGEEIVCRKVGMVKAVKLPEEGDRKENKEKFGQVLFGGEKHSKISQRRKGKKERDLSQREKAEGDGVLRERCQRKEKRYHLAFYHNRARSESGERNLRWL